MLRDLDADLLLVPDSILEERSRLLRMRMSLMAEELRSIDAVQRFKNAYRKRPKEQPQTLQTA